VGGQDEEVLHLPAGTGWPHPETLRTPVGAWASHVGGAVMYSDNADGFPPLNPLLQPVEVPVAEGFSFLEALCAQDGCVLSELRAASVRLIVVERRSLRWRQAIDVPEADLDAWRDRLGGPIRTELDLDVRWRRHVLRVLRELAEPSPGAGVGGLDETIEGIEITGSGAFVHELSRLASELQREPAESPDTSPLDFFPPARAAVPLPAGEQPLTLLELLVHVSAVTGQHFVCSRPERHWLEKTPIDQGGREVVPLEEVWSLLESSLRESRFTLAEVRRRAPRLMSVGRLSATADDELQWARARFVAAERLDELAAHPTLLARSVIRVGPKEAVEACEEVLLEHRDFAEEVRVDSIAWAPGAPLIVTGIVPDLLEARRIVEQEIAAWRKEREVSKQGD